MFYKLMISRALFFIEHVQMAAPKAENIDNVFHFFVIIPFPF